MLIANLLRTSLEVNSEHSCLAVSVLLEVNLPEFDYLKEIRARFRKSQEIVLTTQHQLKFQRTVD